MKTFWKIFGKVLVGFGIGYVTMMGIFTYSKQKDVKKEYNSHIFEIVDSVEEHIEAYYSKEEVAIRQREINALKQESNRGNELDKIEQNQTEILNKEDNIKVETTEEVAEGIDGGFIHINDSMNNDLAYEDDYKVYGAMAIFKDKACVAKSGTYLISNGMNWNLEPIKGGSQYIDLEKWLTQEEIEEIISFVMRVQTDEECIDWIKASGYILGQELYPEKIEIYEIYRDREIMAWRDEDAKLVKEYEFEVEPSSEMVPYESDWWDFSVPIKDVAEEANKLSKRYLERQKELKPFKERLYQWEEAGYRITDEMNLRAYENYREIETETGSYQLAIAMLYRPWNVTIEELKLVYFFSGLLTFVMSLILSMALWRTNQKREQFEKNRRQLVDAIGHELKTPLAIIQTYSEGLKEKIAEDKREHYLEVIIDETNKMNELILEMIELSRLQNSAYAMKLENIVLQQLVEHLLQGKEKWLEEKELKVQLDFEGEEIQAEYKSMERAIHNLLLNAIQHAERGSIIEIGYKEDKFYIQNQGPIIPKEKIDQIWEVFYKVENDAHRSGQGTGLGLAIVAQICERHQMTYGVENRVEGVKFWLGNFKKLI
ncbi:MAG: HAMP domain-containing histidine kinase [Cellulosilyticum sp.]|nr:HAMP domain-containing histidine kinase [Cellulosilyticum sp.]